MEVWLQKGNEKSGPHLDYEVREMIRERKLGKETLAWHEGLDVWKPLGELELFAAEWLSAPPPITEVEVKPVTTSHYLWKRLAARWFDFLLYTALLALFLHYAGHNIILLRLSFWPSLLLYLPWLILEAICLNKWGTTPGKHLLGLSLQNSERKNLALGEALIRSVRVLVLGFGMTLDILIVIGHILNYFSIRKSGLALWDVRTGFEFKHRPAKSSRVVLFALIFSLSFGVFMTVSNMHFLKVPTESLPEEYQKLHLNLKAQMEEQMKEMSKRNKMY